MDMLRHQTSDAQKSKQLELYLQDQQKNFPEQHDQDPQTFETESSKDNEGEFEKTQSGNPSKDNNDRDREEELSDHDDYDLQSDSHGTIHPTDIEHIKPFLILGNEFVILKNEFQLQMNSTALDTPLPPKKMVSLKCEDVPTSTRGTEEAAIDLPSSTFSSSARCTYGQRERQADGQIDIPKFNEHTTVNSTFIDHVKNIIESYVGASVLWWPFRQPEKALPAGCTRLRWDLVCYLHNCSTAFNIDIQLCHRAVATVHTLMCQLRLLARSKMSAAIRVALPHRLVSVQLHLHLTGSLLALQGPPRFQQQDSLLLLAHASANLFRTLLMPQTILPTILDHSEEMGMRSIFSGVLILQIMKRNSTMYASNLLPLLPMLAGHLSESSGIAIKGFEDSGIYFP
jgi:hypothetical protein